MTKIINIGAASVSTLALDLEGNSQKIIGCLREAGEKGADIVLFPELCLTGYGAEDQFFVTGWIKKSEEYIKKILEHVPEGMLVSVGFPLLISGGQVFNAAALIAHKKVIGCACKQFLARNGLHYEPRWFTPWPKGRRVYLDLFGQKDVPVGDFVFEAGGVKIGFEICEDSWVADRPGSSLYKRGADIILNPSASHFAIGKQQIREHFISDGSRAFGAVYAYANLLGCESGRSVFDGSAIIASNGEIVAETKRLSFRNYELCTACADISMNRVNRLMSSEGIEPETEGIYSFSGFEFRPHDRFSISAKIKINPENEYETVTRAVALGMWDFARRTHTSGFALSLSGGADSALCAAMAYYGVAEAAAALGRKEFLETLHTMGLNIEDRLDLSDLEFIRQAVMPQYLITVYQGSEHSGEVTRNAAEMMAKSTGAHHIEWRIDSIVKGYTDLVNNALGEKNKLSWETDDIALQNIQARSRSPGIWLIANHCNKLLIATSNLSEASVGYCTMDGDTSGSLSPIGGISKSRILRINRWIYENGLKIQYSDEVLRIDAMKYIIAQQPTAELRPVEQTDESDLMPYDLMDFIRRLTHVNHLTPQEICEQVRNSEFGAKYSAEQIDGYVKKFFRLYTRNQWKRERLAVSFHIEEDSCDPKSYRRFPVLCAGLA